MLQTPQKSPSISSAPCYQHQYSLPSAPLSPSTSNYSIQSDLARSIDELNQQRAPESKLPNRLSEADFNMQLLKKLDSVIENPIYGERERRRILNYVSLTIQVFSLKLLVVCLIVFLVSQGVEWLFT